MTAQASRFQCLSDRISVLLFSGAVELEYTPLTWTARRSSLVSPSGLTYGHLSRIYWDDEGLEAKN